MALLGWVAQRLPAITRTLRFRLMLWSAALVLMTAAATLIGLREGIRFALLRELDQILEADLSEIELALEEPQRPAFSELIEELQRKARGHSQHGWFVQLLDNQEQVIWSSSEPRGQIRKADGEWRGYAQFGSELRVHERRVAALGSNVALVRVGADLSFLAREVARVDRTAQTMVAIVALLAPIVAYVLTVRAIRPLRKLTQVAARLRPDRLDERLPIRNAPDELDILSRTVNGLLDRIALHLARRRDLLANSAHELRSPLAAIRSSAEVTLQGPRTREHYEELLGEIIEACTSLELLVNQLLLLAETESDTFTETTQTVPLSELAEKAVAMFEGAAEYAHLQMHADIEPALQVQGHPEHLRHVLNNLLDNAIKFTPPGGSVTIRLERTEDQMAQITVTDTGCGIETIDVGRVFERFFRADRARTRSKKSGTGLGLSICQSVVAAHRGDIHVHSEPNVGTRVTVRLPLG